MKVKHTSSVKEYQKAFNSVMIRLNLSVEHAVSIFLNNLKPEIINAVRVGKPYTLPQAYYLARLQKASFAAQSRAIRGSSTGSSLARSSMGHQSSYVQRNNNNTFKRPMATKVDNNRRRRLTPAEMDEKQGICFFCDEKFTHVHKCKAKRQLYSLELEVVDDQEDCGDTEEEDGEVVIGVELEGLAEEPLENCVISLQALNGTLGYKTLRLREFTEQKPLRFL